MIHDKGILLGLFILGATAIFVFSEFVSRSEYVQDLVTKSVYEHEGVK